MFGDRNLWQKKTIRVLASFMLSVFSLYSLGSCSGLVASRPYLTSPISPLSKPVSPLSPLMTPTTFSSPMPPLATPPSAGIRPGQRNAEPSYPLLGILAGISGFIGLSFLVLVSYLALQLLRTRRRIASEPGYLYALLYTCTNSLMGQTHLNLLRGMYSISPELADRAVARILHMHLSLMEQAKSDKHYSFEDWMFALQTRENLAPTDSGSNLIQLCSILRLAIERKTYMQIADLDLDVKDEAGGTLIVHTKKHQARIDAHVADSMRQGLIALGKVSRTIHDYITKVIENKALGELQRTIDTIQAIDLSVQVNSFEETMIRQIGENWRNAGQTEIAQVHYIAGRPVTEPELFFGRVPELTQITQVITSKHVAIWGQRRIGKTSILHQLKGRLLLQPDIEYRFQPVFVNVDPFKRAELDTLFYVLVGKTIGSLESFSLSLSLPLLHEIKKESPREYTLADAEADLQQIIEQLQHELRGFRIRLVWLIDEIDALLKQRPDIPIQLATLACSPRLQPNIVFVFAGLSHPRDLVENEFGGFYSSFHSIEIGPLSQDDAEKLVVEPAERGHFSFEVEAVKTIIEKSNYEPYWIQLLCREALGVTLAQKRTVVTLDDVESARPNLPEWSPAFGGLE